MRRSIPCTVPYTRDCVICGRRQWVSYYPNGVASIFCYGVHDPDPRLSRPRIPAPGVETIKPGGVL